MRRICTSVACSIAIALGFASCGGSSSGSSSGSDNGISSKSPDQIVTAVNSAVDGVNSVHVAGTVSSGGSKTTLDLNLVNGKGGQGSMSQAGLGFKIVAVGNNVYINGSNAFWQKFGGSAAAQLLSGKWLKAPATGQLSSIADLTNVRTLFSQLLSSHGTLAKGSTSTVNGQKVLAVKDTTNGGTLYVATSGKPYPIQVIKSGSDGGQITFDHFNQAVALSPPANSIDISKLQ